MTFDLALKMAHRSNYRCTDTEYQLMWNIVIDQPLSGKLSVVEIGSFMGASSTILGLAARKRGWPLICYDAWATHERFTDKREYEMAHTDTDHCNLFNEWIKQMTTVGLYPDYVTPIVGDSALSGLTVTPSLPCAVCLIDGGHTTPQPLRDISTFKRLVCSGGYMLIHDADRMDVNLAIINGLQLDHEWMPIQAWNGHENRIEVYQKL